MNCSSQQSIDFPDSEPLFLGVDAGGTKTVAWLGRLGIVEPIGKGFAGPANPQSEGFELAFRSILQAIGAAFENAGLSPRKVNSACLCLAGTGRQSDQETVLSWAEQVGLAQRVSLISEAEAVLAAEDMPIRLDSENAAEVALICGTGSLAWGRHAKSARSARAGGWGYLLGDEGSGFWLGQRMLQLACQEADGRAEDAGVLADVLNELQLQSSDQLIQWCYRAPANRQRIASFAPLAFRALSLGLEEANSSAAPSIETQIQDRQRQILNLGAAELARMVVSVINRLGSSQYRLVMAGSVLCNQPGYCKLLEQHLNQGYHRPESLHLVENPVAGALKLATRRGE